MINHDHEKGYTLVETLVALTLLLFLLFLVNDLLPVIFKSGDNVKLKAITEARNQMEETLLLQKYSNIKKELKGGLLLDQQVEQRSGLFYIKISISTAYKNKVLYTLQSYSQKINKIE